MRTIGPGNANRWRRACAALALVLTAGALVPAGSLAAPSVRFQLAIGNASFEGTADPDLVFTVVVTGADGTVKDRETITADSDGYWRSSVGARGNIAAGDRFRARVGSVTVGSLRVPQLTVQGDRVTDRVRGRAPAGSTVSVRLITCPTGLADIGTCDVGMDVDRPVDAKGRWSWNAASEEPRGGDRIYATWSSGGSTVLVPGLFPFLSVRIGTSRLEGAILPGSRSRVSLERSGRRVATARALGYGTVGFIWARFRNAAGRNVAVAAGDIVRAPFAGDAELEVSSVSISVTGGTSAASGVCLPGGTGALAWGSGETRSYRGLTIGVDGTWDAELVPAPPAGATFELSCATQAGDVVRLVGTVPPAP
ncbi:MAG: hypothetical protein ACKOTZ_13405 [Chloroflexota bacterium]